MGRLMESFSDDASGGSPTKIKALGIIKQIDKMGVEKALKKNPNVSDDIIRTVAENYLNNPKYIDLINNLNLKTDPSALAEILKGLS